MDEGAESLLTYNRMLIPRGYGDREAEYWRLINGVSLWDVAAQRQVQLSGPGIVGQLVRKALLEQARQRAQSSSGGTTTTDNPPALNQQTVHL